jgi:hypothetical protein
MTLLLAAALLALLARRLGLLPSPSERSDRRAFEEMLLQMGEDVQWEEHMALVARQRPAVHRMPHLSFRVGRT